MLTYFVVLAAAQQDAVDPFRRLLVEANMDLFMYTYFCLMIARVCLIHGYKY